MTRNQSAMRPGILFTILVLAACSGGSGESTGPGVTSESGVATVIVSGGAQIEIGKTVQLSATAQDVAGKEVSGKSVAWSTSSASVASVSNTGMVTGLAPGKVTITATVAGKTGDAIVDVIEVAVAAVKVSGPAAISVGQSAQLSATAQDASGTEITGKNVGWSTTAPDVASVSANGVITGLAIGSATITATIAGKSGIALVSVAELKVARVSLDAATVTLAVRQLLKLNAVAVDSSGSPLAANLISWTTSDPAIVAVRSDGVVEAIGPGTATVAAAAGGKSAATAVRVISFASITPGTSNVCAITEAGVMYCAGTRFGNQAAPVWTDTRWAMVDADNEGGDSGEAHGCEVTTEGVVMCWGNNAKGELGAGDFSGRSLPVQVSLPERATQVTTGNIHTCALVQSGAIYCWGANNFGQLGNGTSADSPSPARVSGTDRFVEVSAGGLHTCALTDRGTVLCWGRNRLGELGRGTWSVTEAFSTPAAVLGNVQFKSVSLQGSHSCALSVNGDAYCWGQNTVFELGQANIDICDGGHPCGILPRPVSGGIKFQTLTSAGFGACGVSDSQSYCWGMDAQSNLGANSPVPTCPAQGATAGCTPLPMPGTTGLKSLTGAAVNYCGIRADRGAYCWGGNRFGQLGVLTVEQTSTAVAFGIDPSVIPP